MIVLENKLTELMKYMSKAFDELKARSGRTTLLVFHDDADGITSASILKVLLYKLNFNVREICLEKAYPYALRMIHKEATRHDVVIYADIGSPHAKKIKEFSKDSLVIILDHHDAPKFFADNLYNINPEFFGFSGESEVAGSTVAYVFAKHFGESITEYSKLALIGSYEIPGPIRGLNKMPLSDAIKVGTAKIKGTNVLVKTSRGYLNRGSLSKMLTILGSVAYYSNGPKVAVEGCLSDFPNEMFEVAKRYERMRSVANKRLLNIIQSGGLSVTKYIQWFKDRGVFRGMGTKVIGTFCSYLTYRSRLVSQSKYLVGLMDAQPEIPGLGKLPEELVKFSVRVPRKLRTLIDEDKRPPSSIISVSAASKLGGFADGHAYAASGVIPRNRENLLIEEMDKLIDNWRSVRESSRKSSITDFL